jgi:hypothetical protein
LVVSAVATIGSIAFPAGADPMSTSPEQAYDQGQVPNARALSMGGALNALGVSTAALFLNPANMALAKVYHLESITAYSPQAKRQTYGLAVVDSVLNTSHVAGGVGGTWNEFDPSGLHRNWFDVHGGFALPLGEHLALGATVRWMKVDQDKGTGPFGASPASDGAHGLLNTVTFDAGATVSVFDGLRIAVAGHNLTNPGTALAPISGAVGIGYTSSVFSLEADGSLDFTTYKNARGQLMGGAELFLANAYALRAGWRYDGGTNLNSASAGLGYIAPSWSVELAVRHDLVAEHAETLLVLSVRYFYDALGTGSQDQGQTTFQ